MVAAGLSAKIQNAETSKNMRIPSLENKKVVASHFKDFSGIRELEPKLYRMLGINGPVILYKGAIDDILLRNTYSYKKRDVISLEQRLHYSYMNKYLKPCIRQFLTVSRLCKIL